MTNNSRSDGTKDSHNSIIERISLASDRHGALLEEHTHILQDHSGTLKEIRAHLFKLDDIASNTGKLATSVDGALGRVFTMLEKREDNSRKGSIIVTSILGLLLVIMALAVTRLELFAGTSSGTSITIKERSYGNQAEPSKQQDNVGNFDRVHP